MGGQLNRLDPSYTALIVIDVQNDFCDPNGTVALGGGDVTYAVQIVSPLNRTIEFARAIGVPVVFVRTVHGSNYDSENWIQRTGNGEKSPNCLEGTWGAEFFKLSPGDSDLIVSKHRYSAFSSSQFVDVIEWLEKPSLIFAGVATNVCVETTLREAVCRDYLTTLLEDCSAAYGLAEHNSAVENIKKHFGVVLTSDELLSVWERLRASTDYISHETR